MPLTWLNCKYSYLCLREAHIRGSGELLDSNPLTFHPIQFPTVSRGLTVLEYLLSARAKRLLSLGSFPAILTSWLFLFVFLFTILIWHLLFSIRVPLTTSSFNVEKSNLAAIFTQGTGLANQSYSLQKQTYSYWVQLSLFRVSLKKKKLLQIADFASHFSELVPRGTIIAEVSKSGESIQPRVKSAHCCKLWYQA